MITDQHGIVVDHQGALAIIRLDQGRANLVDVEMLDDLAEVLADLAASGTQAVILTGTGTVFSSGFDWTPIFSEGNNYERRLLAALIRAVEAIFRFPGPVVAAVNGHAVAGGCLLICPCDHRLVADGPIRLGFPPIRAALPLAGVTLELAALAVPRHHLEEVMFRGETYLPHPAVERGLVDEVVASDDLIDRAIAVVWRLCRLPADVLRRTKEARSEPVLSRIGNGRTRFEAEISALRPPHDIRRSLHNYVGQTVPETEVTTATRFGGVLVP